MENNGSSMQFTLIGVGHASTTQVSTIIAWENIYANQWETCEALIERLADSSLKLGNQMHSHSM